MGANQSTGERPRSRRQHSNSDAISQSKYIEQENLKKVKLDDLLRHANPRHQASDDCDLPSRIDKVVGLPPPPATTIQRMSKMTVNLHPEQSVNSKHTKPMRSLAATPASPEIIPFIKRRSLIYAKAPGLSTRAIVASQSMPQLPAVTEVAPVPTVSLRTNNGNNDGYHIIRAATPTFRDLPLGSFRPGTLRIVNGAPSPAPSSVFPSVSTFGPAIEEAVEISIGEQSSLHMNVTGDPTAETDPLQMLEKAEEEEVLKDVDQCRSTSTVENNDTEPSQPHFMYNHLESGSYDGHYLPKADHDAPRIEIRCESRASVWSISESQLENLDVLQHPQSGRNGDYQDDYLLDSQRSTRKDYTISDLPSTFLCDQNPVFHGTFMTKSFSMPTGLSRKTRSVSATSSISTGIETAISDAVSHSDESSCTDASSVVSRRSHNDEQKVLPCDKHLKVYDQSYSDRPRGGPHEHRIKVQTPKTLTEMLQVGANAGSHYSMPPSSSASWDSPKALLSEDRRQQVLSNVIAGLPPSYVPFEPLAPGSLDSKVKFHRSSSHFSKGQKIQDPGLGMRLQTPRPIGDSATLTRGHHRNATVSDIGTEAIRHSPRGPRPMLSSRSASSDVILAQPRGSFNSQQHHSKGRYTRSETRTRDITPCDDSAASTSTLRHSQTMPLLM